jgi:hypothetical protein
VHLTFRGPASWYDLIIRIRKITNPFKHIWIAVKCTNILQQLTKPKLPSSTQEQDKNGIYKLTCNTCQMSYIGQISRSLKHIYQEHIRYVRHNEPQSAYAQHILNNKREYASINNTMTLLKHTNKISQLLPHEQLYIQTYHQHRQLISEQYISEHNPIHRPIHNTFNTSLPTRQAINTAPENKLNQSHPDLVSRHSA